MSTENLRDRYEMEGRDLHRYDATEFWDRRYHLERFRHVQQVLQSEIRPGDMFLDLGCGSGEYLALANGQRFSIGVDLSETYCRRALAGAPRVATVVANGTRIPLVDGACDVLLCSEVIEHLPEVFADEFIREILRVTSRTLVLSTPNDSALIRRLARAVSPTRVADLDAEVGHINLLTRVGFERLLSSTGWAVKTLAVHHIMPPVVGERPIKLSRHLSRPAGYAEKLGNALLPSAGNSMIAVLDRT